ncbi:hypothetical protein BJ508DRAFT_301858 [Ascobolus immersus RN42]|uniref:Uncharacterized protein n=1 Tax=Ascobolus immersus RN42 TaxID=1160509 RepID=A0A3N4ILE7_ASCIM|nr:hypothetical protein BJ508DRAFT_301858 [Ascobolus immersus RN42]
MPMARELLLTLSAGEARDLGAPPSIPRLVEPDLKHEKHHSRTQQTKYQRSIPCICTSILQPCSLNGIQIISRDSGLYPGSRRHVALGLHAERLAGQSFSGGGSKHVHLRSFEQPVTVALRQAGHFCADVVEWIGARLRLDECGNGRSPGCVQHEPLESAVNRIIVDNCVQV